MMGKAKTLSSEAGEAPSTVPALHKVDKITTAKSGEGFFGRLVEKLKYSFLASSQPSLAGRVQVQLLQQHADILLEQLVSLREQLQQQLDEGLFQFVEPLLAPMAKDIRRIQKLMSQDGALLPQGRSYKKYLDWIAKAKIWVELSSQLDDQVAIVNAVISHSLAEAGSSIDQDLQLLADYQSHQLATVPLANGEKQQFSLKLQRKLAGHIQALNGLKEKPLKMKLQHVYSWKAEVDRKRSGYFERALQEIDAMVQMAAPVASSSGQGDSSEGGRL
jgi:hypothetical protein